jgi:signal transduction histidine kinase
MGRNDVGEAAGSGAESVDVAAIAEPLADQLERTGKMEALGRFSASVAHDLNNILTAINGYADLALSAIDEADPTRVDIVEIRRSGDRANALTKRLLAVGRRQVLAPTLIDPAAFLLEVHDALVQASGGARLAIVTSAPAARVWVDAGQLGQALVHVVDNASLAMPNGGVITVGTAVVTAPGETAVDPAVPDGRWLRITVVDHGAGMDDTTRRQACEPFFMARPQVVGRRQGAGVGLSIVWGLFTQSGGHLGFGSAPGHGTALRLYLPIADE